MILVATININPRPGPNPFVRTSNISPFCARYSTVGYRSPTCLLNSVLKIDVKSFFASNSNRYRFNESTCSRSDVYISWDNNTTCSGIGSASIPRQSTPCRERLPPSPMRMFFMRLRHFVISSIARFFSDGTSNRAILSRTERTRSCGVFGRLDRLKRNAMLLSSLGFFYVAVLRLLLAVYCSGGQWRGFRVAWPGNSQIGLNVCGVYTFYAGHTNLDYHEAVVTQLAPARRLCHVGFKNSIYFTRRKRQANLPK